MIVQIYEIESNQLHNWTAPSRARHLQRRGVDPAWIFRVPSRHRLQAARARHFRARLRHLGGEEGAGDAA